MNIIFGDLKNWRTLKGTEGFEDGLEFLEKTDLNALSLGKHEILGEAVFAAVSKGPSRAPESGQFESHRKYIDIQYLVSGGERIGVAPLEGLQVTTPYSDTSDVILYSVPPRYQDIVMKPGHFVVFFPENAHLPLCHDQGEHEIHKVVIKVAVDHWKARQKS